MPKKTGDFEVGECFEDSDGWWIVIEKTSSEYNLILAQNTKGVCHKFLRGYYHKQISQEDFLKREKAYQLNKDKEDMKIVISNALETMAKAGISVKGFGISAIGAFKLLRKAMDDAKDDKTEESSSGDVT